MTNSPRVLETPDNRNNKVEHLPASKKTFNRSKLLSDAKPKSSMTLELV